MPMKINTIISFLEDLAPPSLQEGYDNAGLLTGRNEWECTGILCALDATEEVLQEAIDKNCNLVVAHHPIIFGGLKKITGSNYVERTVIKAIRNDIAIYAIHTNLDNVIEGVSGAMAARLELQNLAVLKPSENTLKKLYSFVPDAHAEKLRSAIFAAGGGQIGKYDECSFNTEGEGTFRAGEGTNPFVGKMGEQHVEKEVRVEVVFPAHLEPAIRLALLNAHPYEEPAFDIISLGNRHPGIGSGIIGQLPGPLEGAEFLQLLKTAFGLTSIRHTQVLPGKIKRVALCGGAGSFLIPKALAAQADAYVTGDIKYHEFFDADARMLLADIGHYESEQFTIGLLQEKLEQKFPTFAVLKTSINTNPVRYFG